jgi:tetratricopeptide (TPR) repeat protein
MPFPLRLSSFVLLAAGLASGCGASGAGPLPGTEDLYRYSLAVAERARRLAPSGGAQPLIHVARVHQRFGMDDLAIATYGRALEIDPQAADAYREIGYLLSQRERMGEAIDAYQQAILCDWSQDGIFTRIGLVLTSMGRPGEGVQALEHEVRRGGASPLTYHSLGRALQDQRRHEEAVKAFEEALRLDPGMTEPLNGLFTSLRLLGRAAEAEAAFERLEELKKAETERELGEYGMKSDAGKLRSFTAQTWTDAAELFLGEYNRALQERDRERQQLYYAELLRALGEAIGFDPTHREAHRMLMSLHHSRGNLREALEAGRRAAKALPGDALLLFEVAALHVEAAPVASSRPQTDPRPEVDEALRLLEQAVQADPGFAPAHLRLAELILFRRPEAGLGAKALEHARRALAHTKAPSPRNYDLLAFASLQAGDPGGARRFLAEGLRLFPRDAELAERLRRLEGSR